MSISANHDVIVIGAGVGGLAAATYLGAAGLSVAVLEAGPRIGGKTGVAECDGVVFDTGPSVLTLRESFDRVFAAAGLDFGSEVRLRRPEPAFRYHFPSGACLEVSHDLERTLSSVENTFGRRSRDEFHAYLEHAGRIWEAAAPHFVWSEAPDLAGLLFGGLSRLRAISKLDALRPMRAAIESMVSSPELRMLLERYATYNGSDFRRAPATLGLIAHVELALGGYGVEGGMYELVLALGRAAEHVHVEIMTNEPALEVLVEDGRIGGVRTRGGRLRAQHVVVNADVGHLVESLLPPRHAKPLERTGEPSMSGYNAVYKALRRSGAEARVGHEVWFPQDYSAEFSDIFDRQRTPRDPTLYLCAQEACHGRSGWAQHEPLFVMANAPAVLPGATDTAAEELGRRVDDQLRAAALIAPGDEAVFRRSPADLAAQFPGSHGSIYGAASNSAMAAFKRPPNAVEGLPGLYLASGSAHPGGGLPMVAQSGSRAAEAVLARIGPDAQRRARSTDGARPAPSARSGGH